MSVSSPAVVVDGLTKRYATGVEALRCVSFEVPYGTVFGYLGRNGSGKTTTVRILTTLAAATSGRATVAGFGVATDPAAVRSAIGVTLQVAALDPDMTGREHLELVAGLAGCSRRDARTTASELLDDLGLSYTADRVIRTYSGGMQRRLDFAAAIVRRPRVLFLDEPTTGLDAQSRRALWNRVRALRNDGAAVFLTTQYLEEADALADDVAILDAGRVLARGTPAQIKETTGHATLEDAFIDLTGYGLAPQQEVAA